MADVNGMVYAPRIENGATTNHVILSSRRKVMLKLQALSAEFWDNVLNKIHSRANLGQHMHLKSQY